MIPILIPKNFDLVRLKSSDGKYLFSSDNLALYAPLQNASIPNTNGLGLLSEAVYCYCYHTLNGQYELEMEYPVSGYLYNQIKERCIIVAKPDKRSDNQPFRIYRIKKTINDTITIYARHLAHDLEGIVVKPFTANGIQNALSGLKSNALINCPFTFHTSRTTESTFYLDHPESIWNLLGGQEGSLLDVYGGEYVFDGYDIYLENHIGEDNGVSVRYGVNMTEFNQDSNIEGCFTGVIGYYLSDEASVYGNVINSDASHDYVKILPVDFTYYLNDVPTPEMLDILAEAYIKANNIGEPKVDWTVKFVLLGDTEEYKDIAPLEDVSLGDTIKIKFEKLGIDVSSRVNEIQWNVLLDKYEEVHLGSIRANIATTIANNVEQLSNTPTMEEVTQVSGNLTKTILGAKRGSIRFIDADNDGELDTLYIANHKDPAQATKVWRFNYEGWAGSNNGFDGPYIMGATFDDGIIADFITTGTMSADRIRGGTLRLGGINNVAGSLDVYDENGVFFGKIYSAGYWTGDGAYSTLQTKTGMAIRKNMPGDPGVEILATIRRSVSGSADIGAVALTRITSENVLDRSAMFTPTSLRFNDKHGSAMISVTTGIDETTRNEFGIIGLYGVNSEGVIQSDRTTIQGNGTIYCKRLFVNGHEIT